jgi:hypothetical protein
MGWSRKRKMGRVRRIVARNVGISLRQSIIARVFYHVDVKNVMFNLERTKASTSLHQVDGAKDVIARQVRVKVDANRQVITLSGMCSVPWWTICTSHVQRDSKQAFRLAPTLEPAGCKSQGPTGQHRRHQESGSVRPKQHQRKIKCLACIHHAELRPAA